MVTEAEVQEQFKYTDIKEGDTVMFWRGGAPSGSGLLGIVTLVDPGSICLYTLARPRLWHDCRHALDPILKSRPHLVEEPDCGVFMVSGPTLERIQLRKEVKVLKGLVEDLYTEVHAAGSRLENSGTGVKRGPGRPKKVT